MIYFSPTTSTGILRVPRAEFRLVWAALSFVTEISGERPKGPRNQGRGGGRATPATVGEDTPCVIRVVRVSGTIRKSEEELLRRARREVVRAKMEGRDVESGEAEVLQQIFAGQKDKPRSRSRNAPATSLVADSEEDIMDIDDDERDLDDDG